MGYRILITILIIATLIGRNYEIFIKKYEQDCDRYKEQTETYLDAYGAECDACVRAIDQTRVIVEWCLNIDEETQQQIQERLEIRYDEAHKSYLYANKIYESLQGPNWRNMEGTGFPTRDYLDANKGLCRCIWVGGLSLVSLVGMFINRYTR